MFHILINCPEEKYRVYKRQTEIVFQSVGFDDVIRVIKKTLIKEKEKNFIQKDVRAKKAIFASVNRTISNHIFNFKTLKEMFDRSRELLLTLTVIRIWQSVEYTHQKITYK